MNEPPESEPKPRDEAPSKQVNQRTGEKGRPRDGTYGDITGETGGGDSAVPGGSRSSARDVPTQVPAVKPRPVKP